MTILSMTRTNMISQYLHINKLDIFYYRFRRKALQDLIVFAVAARIKNAVSLRPISVQLDILSKWKHDFLWYEMQHLTAFNL